MRRSFSVLNQETTADVEAVAAAGMTDVNIHLAHDRLQPAGPGTLNVDEVKRAVSLIQLARKRKMGVRLSFGFQYPADWVYPRVPAMVSPAGVPYTYTRNDGSGNAVPDWMTRPGLAIQNDTVRRVAQEFQVQGVAPGSIESHRLGWLLSGELRTPGTGPATVGNLVEYARGQFLTMQNVGFRGTFYLLCAGFGARPDQAATDPNRVDSLSRGEDHAAIIAGVAASDYIVPYCTWLNTTPTSWGRPSPEYEIAHLNADNGNKPGLIGENTGGESLADWQAIFLNAVGKRGYGVAALLDSRTISLDQYAALVASFRKLHPRLA